MCHIGMRYGVPFYWDLPIRLKNSTSDSTNKSSLMLYLLLYGSVFSSASPFRFVYRWMVSAMLFSTIIPHTAPRCHPTPRHFLFLILRIISWFAWINFNILNVSYQIHWMSLRLPSFSFICLSVSLCVSVCICVLVAIVFQMKLRNRVDNSHPFFFLLFRLFVTTTQNEHHFFGSTVFSSNSSWNFGLWRQKLCSPPPTPMSLSPIQLHQSNSSSRKFQREILTNNWPLFQLDSTNKSN